MGQQIGIEFPNALPLSPRSRTRADWPLYRSIRPQRIYKAPELMSGLGLTTIIMPDGSQYNQSDSDPFPSGVVAGVTISNPGPNQVRTVRMATAPQPIYMPPVQIQAAAPALPAAPVIATAPIFVAPAGTPTTVVTPVAPSSSSALTSIESWFSGTMIDSIPNWALLAGVMGALFILPGMLGKKRRG